MTTTTTKARRRVNVPLLRKWSRALRSGKYKQGKGQLRDGDRFCCLGVLCDVSGMGEWVGGWYGDSCMLPSPEIVELLGVDALNIPDVLGSTHNDHLASLNDTKGYTFADIADVVDDFIAAYVVGAITDAEIVERGAGV